MAEGFKVIKLEFKYSNETQEDSQYCEMILEFEATDEHLISWCEYNSNEYQEVTTVSSCEDHENYMDSLEIIHLDDNKIKIESNPKFSQVYKKAYTYNINPYLKKLDKENCYIFNQCIELTPTSEGTIKEIEELVHKNISRSCVTDTYLLIRLIKTFDLYWL